MDYSKEEKRSIKTNRVREAFALAAKEMIHNTGVESVSVRKIADHAGYSLGTVYNHFKNLDELLWLTRDMMLRDVAKFMMQHKSQEVTSLADIKTIFRLFMDYFIEHPNVYRFFYNYQLSKADKPVTSIMDDPIIQSEFAKTFLFLIGSGRFTSEEISLRSGLIVYSMFGMLTLFITNNDQIEQTSIYSQLNQYVELLFGEQ